MRAGEYLGLHSLFTRKQFIERMSRKLNNVLTNSWTFIKVLDRCDV